MASLGKAPASIDFFALSNSQGNQWGTPLHHSSHDWIIESESFAAKVTTQ
jgi:hypothetical protein